MVSEHASSDEPRLPPPVEDDWVARLLVWKDRLHLWRDSLHPRSLDARSSGLAVVGIAALGLLGLVAAFSWWWVSQNHQSSGAPLEVALPTMAPLEPGESGQGNEASTITIHVAGAVASPGLVELPAGSRVADAVTAAGGATDDADLDRINLAVVLADADHVAVPKVGGELPVPVNGAAPGQDGASTPIDVNSASPAELEDLPGVGPATAAAIVAYRTDNGPFSSVSALEAVPGIGPAKLAMLRELVRAG